MNNLINYPNPKKSVTKSPTVGYGNRGMDLENDLNLTNRHYLNTNQAVIHKKPLPIQIVSVDYRKRSAAKITEAYFKTPSTTDYNGIYRGYYLDYDAKETTSLTCFPLRYIPKHQLDHLQRIIGQKGLAFFIIRFTKLNEDYLVLAKDIIAFAQTQTRKSLPLAWIAEKGYLLRNSLVPRICYLEALDMIIKDRNYL